MVMANAKLMHYIFALPKWWVRERTYFRTDALMSYKLSTLILRPN